MQLVHGIKHGLKTDPSGHVLQVVPKQASFLIMADHSGSLFTNAGATGTITFSLPVNPPPGTYFEFCVAAAFALRIDPPSTGAIIINAAAQTDGAYVYADAINESVTLVYAGNNDWRAMATTGTWTSE